MGSFVNLTHKQLEMHGCQLSTAATDALVLKNQAISIHSAEWILIVLGKFHIEILHRITLENEITYEDKLPKNLIV